MYLCKEDIFSCFACISIWHEEVFFSHGYLLFYALMKIINAVLWEQVETSSNTYSRFNNEIDIFIVLVNN